jgi:hypothetical protein
MMQQRYVTFVSPGTFFPESTTQEINAWDMEEAVKRARAVKERYGATPYSFHFTTRSREDHELDAKETARSCNYFLGGTVRTAEEVLAGTDPKEETLRWNVKHNGIKRVLVNTNSYRVTLEVKDEDVVLPWEP